MKVGIRAGYGLQNDWKKHFESVLVARLLENACWILCVISQKLKFMDLVQIIGCE